MRTEPAEAQPAPYPPDSELDPDTNMIESEFITAFRDQFFDNTDFALFTPPVGPQLANDFAAVFLKLYRLVEGVAQPASGAAGSAERLVSDLLAQAGWDWPNATPDVPTAWRGSPGARKKFRRYEVACAMNILMHNRFLLDSGDNPPGWPPKRP